MTVLGAASKSRARIRVLHVIDALPRGGKERQFIELLKGFEHESDFASAVIVMSDLIQYEEIDRITVDVRKLIRRCRYDVSMFWRLLKEMRRFGPDVVHSWNAMCSVYAVPASKLVGARFVNGHVQSAPPGLTFRNRDYLAGKLTTLWSDVVVGNSRAGLEAYRVPPKKSLCIHNGFDMTRISGLPDPQVVRSSLGISTPYVIGMVATFSKYKDYECFFDVAARVTRLRPDVTFVAVGDGPDLPRFRSRYPVDEYPRIRMLGRRSDVEQIVNTFTIGMLFSTEGEGISNSILEYMALGKPVVVSDCPGNAELVTVGTMGFLVENNDVDTAIAHSMRLLDNAELRQPIGKAARNHVREAYSLERTIQAHMALYRRLVARGNG